MIYLYYTNNNFTKPCKHRIDIGDMIRHFGNVIVAPRPTAALVLGAPVAVGLALVGVGTLGIGTLQSSGNAAVAPVLPCTADKICQSIAPSACELLAVLAKTRYHHVFLASLPVPAKSVSHPTPFQ